MRAAGGSFAGRPTPPPLDWNQTRHYSISTCDVMIKSASSILFRSAQEEGVHRCRRAHPQGIALEFLFPQPRATAKTFRLEDVLKRHGTRHFTIVLNPSRKHHINTCHGHGTADKHVGQASQPPVGGILSHHSPPKTAAICMRIRLGPR